MVDVNDINIEAKRFCLGVFGAPRWVQNGNSLAQRAPEMRLST
jgi:hypothetical protein